MREFRRQIVEALARVAGVPAEEIDAALAVPPKPELGDFAFPCFQLAKKARAAPPALAQELAGKLKGGIPSVKSVESAGPYVNFRLDPAVLAKVVLSEAIDRDYGR